MDLNDNENNNNLIEAQEFEREKEKIIPKELHVPNQNRKKKCECDCDCNCRFCCTCLENCLFCLENISKCCVNCSCYFYENICDCIRYLLRCECCRCEIEFNSKSYILILFVIRNLISLGVFLSFFVSYKPLYLKILPYTEYFLITYLVGGFIFFVVKYIQFNNNNSGFAIPALLWIGISIFKFCFYVGILQVIDIHYFYDFFHYYWFSFSTEFLENAAIIFIVYFSFSIIYYLTLTFHLIIDHEVKAFLFILFGIIDISIANLVLVYITKNYIFIYGLIFCSYEFISFNLGFGIYYCSEIEDKMNWLWNALLIEIFSLYPILFIFSIPSIILVFLLYFLYSKCCKR